jgi:hypothetical protein
VEYDHANFSSSVASCQRLAMSPNTQHGIPPAWVELRDDDDLHASFHAADGGMVEFGGSDGGFLRSVWGGVEGFWRRGVSLHAACGVVES